MRFALFFLNLALIFSPAAEGAAPRTLPCPDRFAEFVQPHLADYARIVANAPTRRAIDRLGFQFVGETPWGVAILDAKTFPRGGSGPVRMQIGRSRPDPETGLKLETTWASDEAGNIKGTIVLVVDPTTDRIVFVAVPPGHETIDPEVSRIARKLFGHHRSKLLIH